MAWDRTDALFSEPREGQHDYVSAFGELRYLIPKWNPRLPDKEQ